VYYKLFGIKEIIVLSIGASRYKNHNFMIKIT